MPLAQQLPIRLESGRQAKFPGENVYGAHGQHPEAREVEALGIANAVQHLVYRAIATSGHDGFETLAHGGGGKFAGAAGAFRWP